MRSYANFEMDLGQVGALEGTIDGLQQVTRTGVYINAVVEDAHAQLSRVFTANTHAIARAQPKLLHHVYEAGHVGIPGMQLWRNILKGRGAHRRASFEFRPAVRPNELPQASSSPSGKTLNKKYVFRMKPWIMEYGIPVTVRAKEPGGVLAMYLGDSVAGESQFAFAPEAKVENPGGKVQGNFTAQFIGWWEQAAPTIYDQQVRFRYERDVQRIVDSSGRKARRSVTGKSVGMKSWSLGYDAGYAMAHTQARLEAARYRGGEYIE